jgi:hypothetical protein
MDTLDSDGLDRFFSTTSATFQDFEENLAIFFEFFVTIRITYLKA